MEIQDDPEENTVLWVTNVMLTIAPVVSVTPMDLPLLQLPLPGRTITEPKKGGSKNFNDVRNTES